MNQSNFKTSDMWLAAVLMTLGEHLTDVERNYGPRAVFVFASSASIEGAAESYKLGELFIEPQKLFIQTKLLKARLYDER